MTSELRPAVETRAEVLDQLLSELQDGNAWESTISLLADYADLVQDLLKDREAVRAEQAAEVAKWRDKYNELGQMALEQVSDLGTKLGRTETELDAAKADLQSANRELAKWQALAETLAGALGEIAQPDFSYTGILYKDCWRERTAREALTSYKEARDAS